MPIGTKARGAVSQPVYIVGTQWSGVNVMKEMRSADQIWLLVRREAESAAARDPVFGAALASAILHHPDFAHALAHQIGERLGKSAGDRERFARVAGEAFAASPDLIEAASHDLQSIAVTIPRRRRCCRRC